jgi:hypothetical protein
VEGRELASRSGQLSVPLRKFSSQPTTLSGSYAPVTNPTHDPQKLHEYREKAASLHDLSKGVEERIGQAAESGSIEAAREALGELTLKTKEFEEFRKSLTPVEIFLAKYNVEVVNDHTVSFVVPRGVAPIGILQKAQGLVADRDLIWPTQLERWAKDPKFTTEGTNSERISIDGHVPNSRNKDRTEQEKMVGKENLPSLDHLAVAFAVNWIATREPLFGWYNKNESSHVVRAAGGALSFYRYGLRVYVIFDDYSSGSVAVSSRAPGIKKTR